ncbi:hypothetical protein GCM10027217_10590 [Pseudomaricurvus hydrocarbonicus]
MAVLLYDSARPQGLIRPMPEFQRFHEVFESGMTTMVFIVLLLPECDISVKEVKTFYSRL